MDLKCWKTFSLFGKNVYNIYFAQALKIIAYVSQSRPFVVLATSDSSPGNSRIYGVTLKETERSR